MWCVTEACLSTWHQWETLSWCHETYFIAASSGLPHLQPAADFAAVDVSSSAHRRCCCSCCYCLHEDVLSTVIRLPSERRPNRSQREKKLYPSNYLLTVDLQTGASKQGEQVQRLLPQVWGDTGVRSSAPQMLTWLQVWYRLFSRQIRSWNWCHQMSDFKTKMHQIRFPLQTPLGEPTALPRTSGCVWMGLLLRRGPGEEGRGRG